LLRKHKLVYMVRFFFSLLLIFSCMFLGALSARTQDLSIAEGWKFHLGDSTIWAGKIFNDSAWKPIRTGAPWETQGYRGYDGFAWYRLHVIIPSSIRDKAFLKEKLRLDLGKIDDGDEVYLNGFLIGSNGGKGGGIRTGIWDMNRAYTIPLSDPRIRWDQDNVIAVRVWDKEADGGMYEGKYGISVMDVTDFITINTAADPLRFSTTGQLTKKLLLQSTSEKYDFTGRLNIRVIDPFSGAVVFKQTIGADFSHDRPFEYSLRTTLPENRSYQMVYDFEEGRSKKKVTAMEEVPYVLTPKPGPAPRINGPEIYGVTPGAPFLYRIPVVGQRPLAFAATGLPASLHLDGNTGIITGSLPDKGTYTLRLTVHNKVGSATRNLTVICGDKIALTPALGWNSWNCWGTSVSDGKVTASAKAMSDRLADHGWSYINIDDGWEDRRNDQGEILPNAKFPDMKTLCDSVHMLGLKIGIYSSPGPRTCGGYLGSYQHEEQDAATYARWGIDYLKYDWCSYGEIAPRAPSLEEYKKPYIVMKNALDKTGRDILYSLCQYGMGDVWKWGGEIGANSWRTTGDIIDTWGSMAGIGFGQDRPAPYTARANFNDPDMLVVGKVGWGPSLHNTRLTPDEQYTHISLWCLLSAPLLIGCDMSQMDAFTLGLLTNDEVLAIDQDALTRPARKAWDQGKIQVWIKDLKDGSKAVGIFNLDDHAAQRTIPLSTLGLPEQGKLHDCWRQQDLGPYKHSYATRIPPHGVLLLRIRPAAH